LEKLSPPKSKITPMVIFSTYVRLLLTGKMTIYSEETDSYFLTDSDKNPNGFRIFRCAIMPDVKCKAFARSLLGGCGWLMRGV
jgi:hypothetical protein